MHGDHIKPNHHWCTHVFDQIKDYGPVYGFWSFTYERLNKVLKSYHTNNHGGGEIEVSFFRAFTRESRIYEIVSSLIICYLNLIFIHFLKLRQLLRIKPTNKEDEVLKSSALLMLDSGSDYRGTVAAIANESVNEGKPPEI